MPIVLLMPISQVECTCLSGITLYAKHYAHFSQNTAKIFNFQHEQELENQRRSKKIQSLEEQLADSQEHELRTVRELEKLKIDMQTPVSTAEMVQSY